ncbi:unnamed protein product [Cladocopium goreaui]|uniref:Transmembrane protein n=1 Tax=Cladocopium goreaui TaxID=2562237 RepID=A0A9P1GSP5_9DINO|nr:unnamed protein product [Cladocopium goreaui]
MSQLPRRSKGGAVLLAMALLFSSWAFVGTGSTRCSRRSPSWHVSQHAQEVKIGDEQEVKPSTEVKESAKDLEAKEESEKTVQKKEESSAALAKEDWRPLEAFYEPTQDTVYYSWLSVAGGLVLGGGALLLVQGLNAEYFILVFVIVVIAFGFFVALLGLKAITPEKNEPRPQGCRRY